MANSDIDSKCINTIRLLAVDMVSKANSGHPGAPMGLAPTAHVLFDKIMKYCPKDARWSNRDRFVLSNGHACALQYILNYLLGYNMTMEDLKNFRRVDSKTPGHPERKFDNLNIEATTGPLGQGLSNSVGMAIAEKHLAAVFNKPEFNIIDNKVYCIAGDGCLMEGITSEASSLAGHLKLDNLIVVYDDNHISIDGDINCAFTENVLERYKAYGWQVLTVDDGNNDLKGIEAALNKAREPTGKPTLIKVRTTIGFGSKGQGTGGVHGSPLKAEDVVEVKKKFGFDPNAYFFVPTEVSEHYQQKIVRGNELLKEWNELFAEYKKSYPELAAEFERRKENKLPADWKKQLPTFTPDDGAVATRKLSQMVLEKIHNVIPELLSGSADLTASNLTRWDHAVDFQAEPKLGSYAGRYIRYGVREHAMAAIMNGIASYGLLIPAGGTFLNFCSYAAGAIRLSALSDFRVLYIATHDSIGLGEDGPTHQPIETMAHFRAMPNIMCWRPADGNECSAAYYTALTSLNTPSILALSRQNVPQLAGSSIEKAEKGGYILVENTNAKITLVSTGSEVSLCVEAVDMLDKKKINARVVSLPCFEVFDSQREGYKLTVFPDGAPVMSVEALSTSGWAKYSHEQFGIDEFGASGPYKEVYKKYDMTAEGIAKRAEQVVDFYKDTKLKSPLKRALKGKMVCF